MKKTQLVSVLLIVTQYLPGQENITNEKNRHSWNYPVIQPAPVTDTLCGGIVVTDSYRNLENLDDTAVYNWYAGQKLFCDSIMSRFEAIDQLLNENIKMRNAFSIYPDPPRPNGDTLFFSWYDSNTRNHKIFMKTFSSNRVTEIFSTGKLHEIGINTYYIDCYEPSFNNKYLAISLDGSTIENSCIIVWDIKNKKLIDKKIERGELPHWFPGNKGFFYSQYRKTSTPEEKMKKYENAQAKFHYIGTDPEDDPVILNKDNSPELSLHDVDWPEVHTSLTSSYVVGAVFQGISDTPELYYTNADSAFLHGNTKTKWVKIAGAQKIAKSFSLIKNNLFVLSYGANPFGRLERVNLHDTANREIIYEGLNENLDNFFITKRSIYVLTIKNGYSGLMRIALDNFQEEKIKLPFKGSIEIELGEYSNSFTQNSNRFYFPLETWDKTPILYYHQEGKRKIHKIRLYPKMDKAVLKNIEFKSVLVESHDGTLVPLTVLYRKGLVLNGKNSTIINAYGGSGISLSPSVDGSRLVWINRGYIYAVAHVRGGGENGENWHQQGYKTTKQNTWKDLIACTEYLVKNNYTDKNHVVALGASSGGIAVGRALTERPGLFKAAAILVGECNPLRLNNEKNTVAISEFGLVDDSIECLGLLNMDMYYHISDTVQYPAILFTAGMNDEIVAAWQPAKAVAKLQAIPNKNVILFNARMGAHKENVNSPFVYTFFLWQLGYPSFSEDK